MSLKASLLITVPRNWGVAATALIAAFAWPAPATAADDEAKSRIGDCFRITEPDRRLACYDDIARDLSGNAPAAAVEPIEETGSPVATATQENVSEPESQARANAAVAERRNFGLDRPAEAEPLSEISVVVVSARRAPYGEWILITDDDQIWRQSESRRYRIPDLPFEAEIKKRRFGGFYMVARTFKSGMSVKRMK